MKITTIFSLILLANLCYSQINKNYLQHIAKADSFRMKTQYLSAIEEYRRGFSYLGGKGYPDDRINLAECFAGIGSYDSSFYQFYRILKVGWNDSAVLLKRFIHLNKHPSWQASMDTIRKRNEEEKVRAKKYNHLLISQLEYMVVDDQKYRGDKSLYHKMGKEDSIHYPILVDMFNKYGFLHFDLVGKKGSANFWLLVQHQDKHPSFQESVLKAMKVEVEKGKAYKSNYAYLLDRVYLNTGRKQVYGTQTQFDKKSNSYIPRPLEDPENVNKRRLEMELNSIEEYLKFVNDRFN